MSSRYSADGMQGESQPGSNGQVLANQLGITDADEIAEAEVLLLRKLYEAVLLSELPDRALIVQDLIDWHRRWLGNLYDWAGQMRSVNVSKGGFMFAAAGLIPSLLSDFERDCLARYTPCHDLDLNGLIEAIAVTHVELILIHPFREGNGRLSRLLADAMAVQAGREPLDYSAWDADKAVYFSAIQAGQGNDYEPMKSLVGFALQR
ncbi:Fic family protein [Lysobacter sp. A03]|uniref:Fic/DOC family protein n=1 Tax=Lysobacter sp. A03 TaxID=1199154 RepID=UPI0005B6D463|nr:Fic family protein [Lysobacter sp. A03]KIQ97324.1 Cell filamentation protein fic [Lysobacter sp. A03]